MEALQAAGISGRGTITQQNATEITCLLQPRQYYTAVQVRNMPRVDFFYRLASAVGTQRLALPEERRRTGRDHNSPCQCHGNFELVHENLEREFDALLASVLDGDRDVSKRHSGATMAAGDLQQDPRSSGTRPEQGL